MPERLKPDTRYTLGYYNGDKKISYKYPVLNNSYIFRNSNAFKMVVAERRASQNCYTVGNDQTSEISGRLVGLSAASTAYMPSAQTGKLPPFCRTGG